MVGCVGWVRVLLSKLSLSVCIGFIQCLLPGAHLLTHDKWSECLVNPLISSEWWFKFINRPTCLQLSFHSSATFSHTFWVVLKEEGIMSLCVSLWCLIFFLCVCNISLHLCPILELWGSNAWWALLWNCSSPLEFAPQQNANTLFYSSAFILCLISPHSQGTSRQEQINS